MQKAGTCRTAFDENRGGASWEHFEVNKIYHRLATLRTFAIGNANNMKGRLNP